MVGVTIDSKLYYLVKFGGAKGQPPYIVKEVVKKKDESGKFITILSRPDLDDKQDEARLSQTALEQVNANKEFREIPEFFKTIAYRHILPQVVRDPKGFSPIPVKNDPYGRDFVLQLWNTNKATRTSRLNKINEVMQLAVPQLENFDVDMEKGTGTVHLKMKYRHWRKQSAKQDEMSLSDGTLRLIALLWSLFEEGGPLLLEEPELSLHDEVVRQLPNMFAAMMKNKRTSRQVLISTHSEALLSDIGIGPGEVFRLIPGSNGTEVASPDEEDVGLMQKGLTAAEVLLPKTRPDKIGQLSLLKL